MGGGAAGSMAEEIYIVEYGTSFENENPIFSAGYCKIIAMLWLSDRILEIQVDAPCSVNKSENLWPPRLSVGYPQIPPIEIRLVRDAAAGDSPQRAL
jgi:hypothetical protein